ncbi:MAG: deoxyribonuclease IV [Phycisphaerales bacterium]|nr:deoxyribonuclease IV [Phycisphaerales bacterium]
MASSQQKQRFGAHMSVAGGLENAFHAGKEVGCDCLQIFVKNQRQWKARPLTDEQVAAYKEAERETGLHPVVAHASYLLNLASPEAASREKSSNALIDELTRCEALGVSGLVFHPGAHMGDGVDKGIRRIIKALDDVLGRTKGFTTNVLLETTAGQGSSIGHEIEHLGRIIAGVKDAERLMVCLDTCHLFAAGHDLRNANLYAKMVDELDTIVGLDRIRCIHTNDSKNDCGSRVDRHEHVTKGKIGKDGFIHLVNDPRLAGVPRILETPKGKDGRGVDYDKVNLRRLRELIRTNGPASTTRLRARR